MDDFENVGAVAENKHGRGRAALAAVLGIIFFMAGAGVVLGFGRIGNLFKTGSALVSETFGDVFYGEKGNSFKLADEIDLKSGNLNIDEKNSVAAQTGAVAEDPGQAAAVQKWAKSEQKAVSRPASATSVGETKKVSPESPLANDTAALVATSTKIANAAPACDFSAAGNSTHGIVFSEIAWMGSPRKGNETAAQVSQNEWIELKNNSAGDIGLAGWQILDESEKFNVIFSGSDKIAKGGFYLLERTDDDSVPGVPADKIYSGALPNVGEWLRIFDGECVLVDEINASAGWPGGDNATKQTLERNAGDFLWHTSAAPGGTPKEVNSAPAVAPAATSSANLDGAQLYALGVSIQGGGAGLVTSSPVGIHCGFDCSEQFPAGTKVVLNAAPDANSAFENWSGACAGAGDCAVIVTGTIAVAANFKSTAAPPQAQPAEPPQTPPASTSTVATTTGPNHLVISVVQIWGAVASNDFIKIYNPTDSPIDISSWKLRKKNSSSTVDGYDSVRVFSSGNIIGAGSYFAWANLSGGFAASIGANESSTQTLASNNSVALLNQSGVIVDAVAWGTAPNQYVEGNAYLNYPDSNNPQANQILSRILSRKFVSGVIQDTDNNEQDFEIK